jgi:hypothetical protein
MRFLLLLPEVPRAREAGLPNRGLQSEHCPAVRRSLIANMADVVRRHLGLGHRAPPDRSRPPLS